ncbi:four helix bundle protein [Rufibacter radiotolerans]|uniref:four helix bundle protein n=1 Tax=Rufibacter radiotolerans TaxID=1379910 RepID=UPI0006644F39|nr:four helix bundle protein [Rufibacter radiotolerans]
MEERKYLQLNDIEAYKAAFKLSNYVWEIVTKWGHFEKEMVGKQFARAVDSLSANLAEGFGRFGKKDKINFYRFARGSVYECLDWNENAKVRNLISEEQYKHIFQNL